MKANKFSSIFPGQWWIPGDSYVALKKIHNLPCPTDVEILRYEDEMVTFEERYPNGTYKTCNFNDISFLLLMNRKPVLCHYHVWKYRTGRGGSIDQRIYAGKVQVRLTDDEMQSVAKIPVSAIMEITKAGSISWITGDYGAVYVDDEEGLPSCEMEKIEDPTVERSWSVAEGDSRMVPSLIVT